MLATGTYHHVLSLGMGETEHCPTGGAFSVDVSLSVTEAIAPQLEEAAERLVFTASFGNVAREHSEKDDHDQHVKSNAGDFFECFHVVLFLHVRVFLF